MSISVDLAGLNKVKLKALHHIPCNVEHNGKAKVTEFFSTGTIRRNAGEAEDELQASYRGRPLNGVKKTVPEGYHGLILREVRRPLTDEDGDREMAIAHTFTEYTHWNLDMEPSCNDKIEQALQWRHIARAVHKPVDDSILKKTNGEQHT